MLIAGQNSGLLLGDRLRTTKVGPN